ncbi:MAG: hypothetical protein FJ160_00175 [Gammaproteobacteria bacterium]|nr:hypothetical protein [Gammaproteobacteria bacterium]
MTRKLDGINHFTTEGDDDATVVLPRATPVMARPRQHHVGSFFAVILDCTRQGARVRAESGVPDSPVAWAGFVAGDVLLEIDGKVVAELAEFSEILKTFSSGAKISAVLACS